MFRVIRIFRLLWHSGNELDKTFLIQGPRCVLIRAGIGTKNVFEAEVCCHFGQLANLLLVTACDLLTIVLGPSRDRCNFGIGCFNAGMTEAVDNDQASSYLAGCRHHLDLHEDGDLGLLNTKLSSSLSIT